MNHYRDASSLPYPEEAYDDDMICPGCRVLNPDCEWLDFGIGAYEYWGAPGVDVQWAWVTRCCEADPEPFRPEPDDDEIDESEVA